MHSPVLYSQKSRMRKKCEKQNQKQVPCDSWQQNRNKWNFRLLRIKFSLQLRQNDKKKTQLKETCQEILLPPILTLQIATNKLQQHIPSSALSSDISGSKEHQESEGGWGKESLGDWLSTFSAYWLQSYCSFRPCSWELEEIYTDSDIYQIVISYNMLFC